MDNVKMYAIIAAAFIAGAFVASPDLRAYAANTVFSADIVDGEVKTADLASNSVTAAKIKDGEVKAAEIGADAVGGSELIGVSKLLFGQCLADSTEGNVQVFGGDSLSVQCMISGVDSDDSAIAAKNSGNNCFDIRTVGVDNDLVTVVFKNACSNVAKLGIGTAISVLVYDK